MNNGILGNTSNDKKSDLRKNIKLEMIYLNEQLLTRPEKKVLSKVGREFRNS